MSEKIKKPKFNIGDNLYFLEDGYASRNIVKCIISLDEDYVYSFEEPKYRSFDKFNGYLVESDSYKYEDSVFKTLDGLLKSIKDSF